MISQERRRPQGLRYRGQPSRKLFLGRSEQVSLFQSQLLSSEIPRIAQLQLSKIEKNILEYSDLPQKRLAPPS